MAASSRAQLDSCWAGDYSPYRRDSITSTLSDSDDGSISSLALSTLQKQTSSPRGDHFNTPRSRPSIWSPFQEVAPNSPDTTKPTLLLPDLHELQTYGGTGISSPRGKRSSRRRHSSKALSPVELLKWAKKHQKQLPRKVQAYIQLSTSDDLLTAEPHIAYRYLSRLRTLCAKAIEAGHLNKRTVSYNSDLLQKILNSIQQLLNNQEGIAEKIAAEAETLYQDRSKLQTDKEAKQHDQHVLEWDLPLLTLKYGQLLGRDFEDLHLAVLSQWSPIPTVEQEWNVAEIISSAKDEIDMRLCIASLMRGTAGLSTIIDSRQFRKGLVTALKPLQPYKSLFMEWLSRDEQKTFFSLPQTVRENIGAALFDNYFSGNSADSELLETYRFLAQVRQSIVYLAMEGNLNENVKRLGQELYSRSLQALSLIRPKPEELKKATDTQVRSLIEKRRSLQQSSARRAHDKEILGLGIPLLNLSYLAALGTDPADSIIDEVMPSLIGKTFPWEWDIHSISPVLYPCLNRYIVYCRSLAPKYASTSGAMQINGDWIEENAKHAYRLVKTFRRSKTHNLFCQHIPTFLDKALAARKNSQDHWAFDRMILIAGEPQLAIPYLKALNSEEWREPPKKGSSPLIDIVVDTHRYLNTLKELLSLSLEDDHFLRSSSSLPSSILSSTLRHAPALHELVESFFQTHFPNDKEARKLLVVHKALQMTGTDSQDIDALSRAQLQNYTKWLFPTLYDLARQLKSHDQHSYVKVLRTLQGSLQKTSPGRAYVVFFLYGICPLIQDYGFYRLGLMEAGLNSPRRQLLAQFLKTLQGLVNIQFDPEQKLFAQQELNPILEDNDMRLALAQLNLQLQKLVAP